MFDADTAALLYWYAVEEVVKTEGQPVFGRGITSALTDIICVGTSAGNILVFHIPHKGTNITLSETLKGQHFAPICDMDSGKSYVVSSDEAGDIMIWKAGDQFQTLKRIKGKGMPCSSVRLWNDIVVGGYGCGHVRLYRCPSGKIFAEIAAHAKWINAIDVSSGGKLMTVGEDSYAHVWKLQGGGEPQVSHLHTELVTDLQLQGAAFVHPDGNAFGVTGYDWNELVFYTKTS